MKAIVSIITPTYNAEKYIGRCLDYSLGQSYQNIEVVIIDDGSSDSTLEIVKKYTKKDSRVKLVQQKHSGPNAARKKGIKAASGDYVMFVDADDFIDDDAVKILVESLQKSKVDSVRFNADYYENKKMVHPIFCSEIKEGIIDSDKMSEMLLTTYKMNSLCFRIYRKESLEKIRAFDYSIRFGEDFLVNLEMCNSIKKTLIIDDVLYHYCNDNLDSTTRGENKEKILKNLSDRVFVSKKAIEYTFESIKDIEKKNRAIFAQLRMVVDSIQKFALVKNYKKEEFIKDIRTILPYNYFSEIDINELSEYINSLNFPMRKKNKAIILAIVYADYEYIWRYIRAIRLYKRLRFRRRG